MRVIGIDPGYDRIGIAILEKENNKEVLLHSECLETFKDEQLADRLVHLGTHLQALIDEYSPSALAIETLFFNKNQKTAMGVAQARGIIIFLCKQAGCSVYEFSPQEVKVAVTGYGKSDKQGVIDMVKRLVPEVKDGALDDEYDAVAVGITCLAHYRRV
jgi:crossover junction endodeoxyribonuclease RuvC